MSASAGDELIDEVDDDDRVIGVVTRRQMRAGRLLHRATSIAVFGTDGRLLIHRRSTTKDIWPGRWDLAAGGVVSSGESTLESARRELFEELGVPEGAVHLVELGHQRYTDDATDVFTTCFQCVYDGPFEFVDGEVAEVRWVTRPELDVLLAAEPFVGDNPVVLLPRLRWP